MSATKLAALSPKQRTLLELRLKQKGSAEALRRKLQPRPRHLDVGALPLSFAQQRLWFLHQLTPDSVMYNIATAARLTGELNRLALEQALSEIVRRHEVLRTTFTTIDGQPVQIINEARFISLPPIDLSELTEADRKAAVRRMSSEEAHRPFDLQHGPLLRVVLLKLGALEHVVLFALHHIVCDGLTLRKLLGEVSVLYGAFSRGEPSPLKDLPVQYADYAYWQRQWLQGETKDAQVSYWKKHLHDPLPTLKLRVARARPSLQSYSGSSETRLLSSTLRDELKELSQREEATLYMTLLTAFNVLLSYHSGQRDILVGTPVADRGHVELEELIGCFLNTLVMRTDLSGNPTFRELLRRVREMALNVHAHQDLPFEMIVDEVQPVRSLNQNPLFQVAFTLENAAQSAQPFPDLTVEFLEGGGTAVQFDLVLHMVDMGEGLLTALQYSTDLFDAAAIAKLLDHFEILLHAIVARPDITLEQLNEMLAHTDSQQKLAQGKAVEEAGLHKLRTTKRRAISATSRSEENDLVNLSHLTKGATLPLVIEPAVRGINLNNWAASQLEFIRKRLLEHGGILFRNFNLTNASDFEQFIQAVSGAALEYNERSSSRSQVSGNIYTSTNHPATQQIFLHNENSYQHAWPMKIFFFCERAAEHNGETPIADVRKVYARIRPEIRERFREKNWMYVRNFGDGFGLSWQTVFQTSDKAAVENHCRKNGIEVEWKAGDRLRTRAVRSALARHPQTGEMVWFNHATFFHVTTLEPETRDVLLTTFGPEDLPTNTFYGDGSLIEPEVLDELREAYRRETVTFPWQEGDILLLDNMLVAHGRAAYSGPRKILVGMAEPCSERGI
jgi:alpha-ketoglutarate-dependent taurine dioxygenase